MKEIVDSIGEKRTLSLEKLKTIVDCSDKEEINYLYSTARKTANKYYGNRVYIRGLIEFTNRCKNDCYYCGLRASNKEIHRYCLSEDDIFRCCENGYSLGFRTFVLQGGEDPSIADEDYIRLIQRIKTKFPDCAITLSIGERSRKSYERLYEAGADRYLLRHETANEVHYRRLHPENMSFKNRMRCISDLKQIGYQTGVGFMVGSPYQTIDNIYQDLCFIRELSPEMVGIGPFIPHKDTPFGEKAQGSLELTLKLIAIIRLLLPSVLLPATTALGSIDKNGRERGILAGANVVMPNLSPVERRADYSLYNNKLSVGAESAEGLENLKSRISQLGYSIVSDRGDFIPMDNA